MVNTWKRGCIFLFLVIPIFMLICMFIAYHRSNNFSNPTDIKEVKFHEFTEGVEQYNLVTNMSVDEIQSFYQKELTDRGWKRYCTSPWTVCDKSMLTINGLKVFMHDVYIFDYNIPYHYTSVNIITVINNGENEVHIFKSRGVFANINYDIMN